MECTYQITTAARPRVLARLVQLFDEQRLTIRSLALAQTDSKIDIRIEVEVDESLARRLEAKLWHQLDIQDVRLELVSKSMSLR